MTPQFGSLLCNLPPSPCSGNQFPSESQGKGLAKSLELFLVLWVVCKGVASFSLDGFGISFSNIRAEPVPGGGFLQGDSVKVQVGI